MSKTNFEVDYVKPREVTVDFTRQLQSVALEAWSDGLSATRSRGDIVQAFNPSDPQMVSLAQEQYYQFARHGNLVTVSRRVGGPILGFSMSRNDVSPKEPGLTNLASRTTKRALSLLDGAIKIPGIGIPNKVYIWNKHTSTRPDAPKGVGTAAISASIRGNRLRPYPDRVSTVYIFDENIRAQKFFGGFGYYWDGDEAKPVPFFGSAKPALQRRYIARVPGIKHESQLRLKKYIS